MRLGNAFKLLIDAVAIPSHQPLFDPTTYLQGAADNFAQTVNTRHALDGLKNRAPVCQPSINKINLGGIQSLSRDTVVS
jgi:hypothetical protein